MHTKTFQVGNTIRLMCRFKDFNEELIDPALVKLKFYDYRYQMIHDVILGPANKLEAGVYFYDYQIPDGPKERLHYEWYAEDQGTIALKRDSFMISFL